MARDPAQKASHPERRTPGRQVHPRQELRSGPGASAPRDYLERHPELNRVFATLDTGLISAELEAMLGRSIRQPGSMLLLYEIQTTPAAIQALRYLYEDIPELPVIAAGSTARLHPSRPQLLDAGRADRVSPSRADDLCRAPRGVGASSPDLPRAAELLLRPKMSGSAG